MLHHVDDETSLKLLRDAVKFLAKGGLFVIYEPEAPRPSNGWLLRFFCHRFEQGAFLRSRDDLISLIEQGGITLDFVDDTIVRPGIVKRPFVARFNLLVGVPGRNV